MNQIWGREPAMVIALVESLLLLAMAFGFDLTAEQMGAIMAPVAILLGLITRSRVTPAGSHSSEHHVCN